MKLFKILGEIAIEGTSDANKAIDSVTENASTAASKISTSFDRIGTASTKIGTSLTNKITKPAIAAATALGGMVLAKGWSRMTEIDTAQAKLHGLGMTVEEIAQVSNDAMESVTGTAFGYDEAMTTAAGATAAGIKPGQELSRYLRIVADSAAMSGRSMSDMGSIMNKCATSNAAFGEELNQLADSGIPVYTWIAKEAGITAEEVKDAASKGKISLDMLEKALEDNMAGAAKTIGSTTIIGSISNIGASFSRIGANIFGATTEVNSFSYLILQDLNSFHEWLGGVETKAKETGHLIAAVYAYLHEGSQKLSADTFSLTEKQKVLFDKITPIIDVLKKVINTVDKLDSKLKGTILGAIISIGPLMKIFGKMTSKISDVVQASEKYDGTLAEVINGTKKWHDKTESYFSDAAKYAGQSFGDMRTLISDFSKNEFEKLISKFSGFNEIVKNKLGSIKFAVSNELNSTKITLGLFADGIHSKFNKFGPLLENTKKSIGSFGNGVLELGKGMGVATLGVAGLAVGIIALASNFDSAKIEDFSNSVTKKINDFANNLPAVVEKIVSEIKEKLPQIVQEIPKLISSITKAFMSIVGALSSILPPLMSGITSLVMGIVGMLPTLLPPLVQSAVTLFTGLVNALALILPPLLSAFVQLISLFAVMIPTLIPTLITAAVNLFTSIVDAIPKILPPLIAAFPKVINAFLASFPILIPAIVNAAVTLFTAIIDAVPQIIKSLKDEAPKIISGLIEGLKSAWPALKEGVVNTGKAFMEAFRNFFDMHSPSRLMSSEGGLIGDGLINGIKDLPEKARAVFLTLRDKIVEPIETAKNWIADKIQSIKNAFDFELKFRGIKVPKISLEWSQTPAWMAKAAKFLGMAGVPKFNVEAYANGGILDQATIFGMNNASGRLMLGGEAGKEAVAPIGTLQSYVTSAVQAASSEQLDKVVTILATYLPQLAELQLVLDDGTLVGKTASKTDEALGNRYYRKARGTI